MAQRTDDDGDQDWIRHLEGPDQQAHRYTYNDDVDNPRSVNAAGLDEIDFRPTTLADEYAARGYLRTNKPVGDPVPANDPEPHPLLGGTAGSSGAKAEQF